MYILKCILYGLVCSGQCAVFSVQCAIVVFGVYCPMFSVKFGVQYAVCSLQCTVYVYSVQCAILVSGVYSQMYIVRFSVQWPVCSF